MRYINRNFTTVYSQPETGRRVLSDGVDHQTNDTQLIDTNSYVNNTAIQSGNIASYPASFSYTFKQDGKSYNSTKGEKAEFAPG